MARTYLVTGAASGIGQKTAQLLSDRGNTVIRADVHDADIKADLTTPDGRAELIATATDLSHGSLDAVVAVAGLALEAPMTVAMNYFGTLATLDGLRPLLSSSNAPRAVAVTSTASLHPVDDELVSLMTGDDELGALARAECLAPTLTEGNLIYSSTKKALAQWIRRSAPTSSWAGARIPLNAIAPGVITTPMTADALATPEGRKAVEQYIPMPLNGIAEPIATAYLLSWLSSEENTHLCGQVIFIDGGNDALLRGDSTW